MTKQITTKLPTALLISLALISLITGRAAKAAEPPVLITEVQTGLIDDQGVESPKLEFVEIANISGQPVDMTGWRLEYLSAANAGPSPSLVIDNLSSQIAINGYGLWTHEGYYPVAPDAIFGFSDASPTGFFAKSGGHIRLMNGTTMIDCVAWGSAVSITGCDKVNSVPTAGYSLQRPLTPTGYSKLNGVANLAPSTPKGGNIYAVGVVAPVAPPFIETGVVQPQKVCDSVVLSEILANPAGDDGANEYIELYNPTNIVQSLYGCSLRLASGKFYEFPSSLSLASGEYRAFDFATTDLQLTNSGGTVTLTTITGEVSVSYPAAGDDQSWVFIDGAWQVSTQPTPNAANVLPSAGAEPARAIADTETSSCGPGKYRHPETNRCRNIVETSQIETACAPDQERNPATGRCRKKLAATVAAACPAGQERNLTTNRCRKVETANSTTKACEAGQERNPDTGRCKKIATSKAAAVLGTATKKTYHLVLVTIVVLALVGYGVYEYRHDMRSFFLRLKKRFARD